MATQTLLLFLSPVQLIAIAALTCGLIYTLLLQRESFPLKAPQLVSGDLPAVGQLGFWTERFDFWSRALSQTKSKNFSFHIGTSNQGGGAWMQLTYVQASTKSLVPTANKDAKLSSITEAWDLLKGKCIIGTMHRTFGLNLAQLCSPLRSEPIGPGRGREGRLVVGRLLQAARNRDAEE